MPATIDAPPANVVPPATAPKPVAEVAAAAAQVQVDATKIGASPDPGTHPPKPGSGRAKLGEELRKKFGGETTTEKPSLEPPASTPEKQEQQVHAKGSGAPKAPDPAPTPAPAPAPEKGKEGKVSPWKLVDQFKERAAKAEARVLELEKAQVSPEKAKETSERYSNLEKEAQAMREELRYFNAEKYDPDVSKAEAEYQGAWKRALSELGELTVDDGAGNKRPLSGEDLMTLVSMPLVEAAELADKVFGRFAPQVLDYRKEIKTLFQAKQAKLEELKKSGATREKDRMEAHQKQVKEIADFTRENYQKAVNEGLSDPKFGQYFQPKEGDDEWNTRLQKATDFVDKAILANSSDPRLSPEDRKKAVQQHAAIRNRAIGWSMMLLRANRAEAEATALKKELAEYKSTTPSAEGRTSTATNGALHGMAALKAKLRDRAVAR